MALLIGPLVAILGVFAAFIVIRGRARTRKSVYSTLRSDRELRVRAARERALSVHPAAPLAAQPAPEPPAPAVAPARPAWDVSPTSPAPAQAAASPPYTSQAPVVPPVGNPVPAPLPAEAASAAAGHPQPAVEPATEQRSVPAAAATGPGPGWQAVPHAEKRHLAGREAGTEDGELHVSMAQQVLSYAGLVAALVVVLLGVVLMVASSH